MARFWLPLACFGFLLVMPYSGSADPLSPSHILGRWVFDWKETDADPSGDIKATRTCGSVEFFKNQMANFRGEGVVRFISKDKAESQDEIRVDYLSYDSWDIIDSSIFSITRRVSIRVKKFFLTENGKPLNDDQLREKRVEFEEQMKFLAVEGETEEQRVILIDDDKMLIEKVEDNGDVLRREYKRSKKLIEGCSDLDEGNK